MAFWRTVRFKFTLIILFSILAVATLLVVLGQNQQRQNTSIFNDRAAERQESFEIISELESQPLKGLTIENTYWDDMVSFINKPTTAFEQDVLRSQLESYNASAIWTYDTSYRLVSNTNNLSPKPSVYTLGIDKPAIQGIFADGYLAHFYRQSSYGLLEVYGATVHDSSDVGHKTAPKGYFFIARQLDTNYVKDLELKTKDSVVILPVAKINEINSKAQNGRIVFYTSFTDESKRAVATTRVTYNSPAIASLYSSLDTIRNLAAISFIILGILIYVTLTKIVVQPLNKVRYALLTEDVSDLAGLENQNTEFGRIASLIVDQQEQKNAISTASVETKRAKDALEARTKELETTNALMIDRELRMVELKKENKELRSPRNT